MNSPSPGCGDYGHPHPRRKFLLALAALLLVGFFAALQLMTWPVRLRYPGEWCSIEGMRLAEMQHLRQGVRIYDPALPERFDAAIYGPLYYLLGACLIDPQAPAYFPLRMLSALGTLGCAGACGLLAFWLVRSYLAAALAPLVFLAYGFVTFYGTANRADSVALFLVFAAVLVAFRLQKSRGLLLAAPLMLLGLFYKQQFIAAPAGVAVSLLLRKQYRTAAEFAGLFVFGGLGFLVFFQFVAFPGQAFLRHFILYNLLPYSLTQFAGGVAILGLVLLVPILVAVEFLRACPDTLLSCYLGCALLLALLAIGKTGSDTNYFLECILILSALYAGSLAKRLAERSGAVELLVLLGAMLFMGQLFTPPPPQRSDFDRDRALQDFLRRNIALHSPALGYYTGDLLRAGLQAPVSDLYQYAQLIRRGTLSDRDLVVRVEERGFRVIIVTFDLQEAQDAGCAHRYLTEGLRSAILEHYQPVTSLELPGPEKFHQDDRFYAWVPRPDRKLVLPIVPSASGHPYDR